MIINFSNTRLDYNSLTRVLRPRGLLMVWTNGDCIVEKILPKEKQRYSQGKSVVRDQYEEGKKMYLSFHPPGWVEKQL